MQELGHTVNSPGEGSDIAGSATVLVGKSGLTASRGIYGCG